MANTLRIKRRASGAAGAPTTSQCVNAELAFNEVDGILYYGKGGSDTASSSVIAIGAELGTGVAAFLKTPSSANLATALGDETGTNAVVFSNNPTLSSPTLTTPVLGTPSSGTLTNCTGLPISTGVSGLGTSVATFLATPSSANLISAITDETGSGALVFANTPTLVTPNIGVASATSVNKVAITAPATSATLTIADGKTLTANRSLTFTGTDSTTMTFPAASTTVAGLSTAQTFTAANTFGSTLTVGGVANFNSRVFIAPQDETPANNGVFIIAGSGDTQGLYITHGAPQSDAIKILPAESGMSSNAAITITTPQAGLFGNTTLTLPAVTGRLATIDEVTSAVASAIGASASTRTACAAATTANITLSGTQPIDGYSVSVGDRVLVKNQTTGANNGIYVAAAGAWARATDADTSAEVTPGIYTYILNGTTNGNKTFILTTSGTITLGTTSLTFADFSTTTTLTAGAGLTKTNNTFDVGTASSSRIVVNADDIDLATVGTAGTYAKVTTDAYGRVTSGSAQVAIGSDVSGLGTGVATFLGTPNSSNLASAVTDETGSGSLVFGTSPNFTTGVGIASNPSTFSVFAEAATTLNAFSAAGNVNIANSNTGTLTVNIGTAATGSGSTKTINIGNTGASGSTTNIVIGTPAANGTSTTTLQGAVVVSGNLTVNGTTTILNTNTLSVDDKNIEIGAVASTTVTCNVTSGSATVTNLASTKDITVGSAFTNSSGFLGVTVPANTTVASIDSATQLTLSAALTGTGSATNATAGIGGATDATANLGGITLKGATDKTIIWDSANSNWTSSEHWNIASGKVFKINNVQVLSATALGSNVTGSSLTSVGTISSGTWNGSAVTVGYGGTGLTSAITGLLRGDGSAYSSATAGTHYVVGGTTTVGKLITQASVTTGASLQITAMTAQPSAPVAGDLWNNAGSLRFYNGAEKTIAFTDSTITGNAANVTGTVAIGNGGTGQTTAGAAFNALSPVTTLGDLIYGSGTNTNTRLAGNTTTTRRVLTQTGTGSASAAPVWVDQCNIVSDCTLDGGTF